MSDLVSRLSEGQHPVTYRARRDDPQGELRAAIDRKYVHVLFTETKGGTELGFRIDEERSDLSEADKVRIDRLSEEWAKVALEDGRVGWVPVGVLETI